MESRPWMTCWDALCSSSARSALRKRPGGVLEAVNDDPADAAPAQLQEHAGGCRGQFGVDQQRKGGKELPEAPDPVGLGRAAAQQRVDHRHLHRLGADRLDGFRPRADRLPDEAVGIEGAKPEKPLGGDGGEQMMSQNGP